MSSEEERTPSTPSEDDEPVRSQLRVSLKRHRGLDPYTAALSNGHEIASHHVLTLISKATRFGTSTIHASAKSLRLNQGKEDGSIREEADNASIISQHLPHWIRNIASSHHRSQSMMPLLSFQNPWESFKSAGLFEAWHGGLQWGLPEGYVEGGEHQSMYRSMGRHIDESEEKKEMEDIKVIRPDWESHTDEDCANNIRVTWLGHATTLLQLPNGINILFDPIFVDRASPSQNAGPIRFTPPPCQVSDLPKIDIVCISHNHYDHLSWDCIKKLREKERERGGIKIFCPLGHLSFFKEAGFEKDSVVEMDWWDEAELMGEDIQIICTPAQHGSGRGGGDQGTSLWSSWLLRYKSNLKTFQTFFAGDTGLRSHNTSRTHRHQFSACPIFREISLKYGVPQLLLLPISVGSSLSYFRSWDPFPRRFSPFPRVEASMTSAIHMDSEDAAHCHQIMSLQEEKETSDGEAEGKARQGVKSRGVTSLAVHYGTFVRNEHQTREDVRDLRRACEERGIDFAKTENGRFDVKSGIERGRFLVSNQGETLFVPL